MIIKESEKENYYAVNTLIEGADEHDTFYISIQAVSELRRLRDENTVPDDFYLRIKSSEDLNQGVIFSLEFDGKIKSNDRLLKAGNEMLLVDNITVFYIMGLSMDYIENENSGKGFVFHGVEGLNF